MFLHSIFNAPGTKRAAIATCLLLPAIAGCRREAFPSYPDSYREYAYVTDGASNSVAVLDLLSLQRASVLPVGLNPTGITANPVGNEVYAVNTGSNSISVIDAERNEVTATVGVGSTPYSIEVSVDGKRGYVPNSASNNVSVLDLRTHRNIATIAAGEAPGVARLSADNHTLVVSNRVSGSVSIYSVADSIDHPLALRSTFAGCPGATDIALVPGDSSSKAFIACSGGHQVMVLWLAVAPDSWHGTRDPSLQHDHLLALLDVGQAPTHVAVKPSDFGEVFVTNFDSDSVSEISTYTNEVSSTYTIGSHPSQDMVSSDGSALWVTNFGADSVALYSIDDGKLIASIRTGSGPDAIAFCADMDEHLVLVADSRSGDVAIIRNQSAPSLLSLLPAGSHPNAIAVKKFTSK